MVTAIRNPDGPLALARRRLADAVHALVAPSPVWDSGVCRWSDSLYARLRVALAGTAPRKRAQMRRSKLPCRGDVLDLLLQIDTTVAGWEPHGKTTVERLRQLAGHAWRPQDCDLISGYSGQLERWAVLATDLLAEQPKVSLQLPCPRCEARFAYRRDGAGERVRVWALRLSEAGCTCLACGGFWGPERFEWLARLLGCDPVVVL